MVTKIVKEDIKNMKGEKILKGEKVEIIKVFLNSIDNDVYVSIKNKKGVWITTSISMLEIN